MAAPFLFRRTWHFEVAPDEVWRALCRTEEFRGWWGWLQRFDAPPLAEGITAQCTIGPPLPYALHVRVTVDEVVPERLIRTSVSGDVTGPARLVLRPHGAGTDAELDWELEVRRPLLLGLATVARPALVWGHEWVVRTGVEQFENRALNKDPRTGAADDDAQ